MKKILLPLLTILMMLLTGCGSEYKHLSMDDALEMIQSDANIIILDVRTQEEYDKKHITNAILLPISEIKNGKFSATLPDKNRPIMTYCWTGRRAEDAASILSKAGYTNVYDIGGLINWTGSTEGSE